MKSFPHEVEYRDSVLETKSKVILVPFLLHDVLHSKPSSSEVTKTATICITCLFKVGELVVIVVKNTFNNQKVVGSFLPLPNVYVTYCMLIGWRLVAVYIWKLLKRRWPALLKSLIAILHRSPLISDHRIRSGTIYTFKVILTRWFKFSSVQICTCSTKSVASF